MGAGDSKLNFKKSIFRLAEEHDIAASDPYWLQFWELPETAEDVFNLFSATDIRRTRDTHLENLETLILALTSRLFVLRHHPSFPDPDLAPEKDALNCIRVLTRILPFIYETDKLAEWEDKFFWGVRRKRVSEARDGEVIFDGDGEEIREPRDEEYRTVAPLGEELIDCLVDLLFFKGFTIFTNDTSKSKVSYSIWQSGVGATTAAGASKELEDNRIEVLRCLLSVTSKAMYLTSAALPEKGTKALTYMATSSDKQLVLTLLCSLLNTTLKYNPASWRVPYDHVVYYDPRQALVTYSLQLLLVLVLYPIPEMPGPQMKNSYRHYLGRLHRSQDFQFIVDGMTRLLNQPIQANASLLPGSKKSVKWAPEMCMLFWETLQCNKRFRSFIVDTDRAHDFVVLITYYALEYRLDPSKAGVVRMCVFVLQTMSSEAKFGKGLNKRFENANSLPASVRIPSFSGTYADYLIISIYNLITTSKGRLSSIYQALLAILKNIAPHVTNLSATASAKLMQLFTSMSAPSFFLANETNNTLLSSLLECFNAIIEHQYKDNANFIYAIIRNEKKFQTLRNFTLESAQEELERAAHQKKDAGDSPGDGLQSPTTRSNTITLPPRREEDLVSPSAFHIGDDDSDEEDSDGDKEEEDTPVLSPTVEDSRSIHSEDPSVPVQLRGMSEKSRGKLPEGAHLTRRSTSASLASVSSTSGATVTNGPFNPTARWIDSWHPLLPLHTILTLLDVLAPIIKAHTQKANTPGSNPNSTTSVLQIIRTTPNPGIESTSPKIHMFEWSTLALGWYESLLWGLIFSSEMAPSKGTVGVWNGTAIRLFIVQETSPESPSLLAPRGGVDAIGTSIVERLNSVAGGLNSAGGAAASSGGQGSQRGSRDGSLERPRR